MLFLQDFYDMHAMHDLRLQNGMCNSPIICVVLALTVGTKQPKISARLYNILYTAEQCIQMKIKKNKVPPPYINSPYHKVAYRNSTVSYSVKPSWNKYILGKESF